MLKLLFLIIQHRLESEMPGIITDWYLNQYAQSGDDVIIDTPAAFIEFGTMTAETMGNKAQLLELGFTVHLCSEALYDDSQRITDSAINHTGFCDDIYKALQGWDAYLSDLQGYEHLKGTSEDRILINRVVREQISPDNSLSNIMVTKQTFSASAFDYSAMRNYTALDANLHINR